MPSPYTSARTGLYDASDVDTWGQGMGVFPQLAGDIVTVAVGHVVTYNRNSAVALGLHTLNGTLQFSTAMNTLLTLGAVDIDVNATGKLLIGTAGVPLPTGVTAGIVFTPTSDNTAGIHTTATGGQVLIYGNPALYGSTFKTSLTANWTAGDTFQIAGDMTTRWAVGQILYVNKGLYSAILTDTFICTIKAMTLVGANTNVQINEAFPGGTFYAGGFVLNASRNVLISKAGASTTIGNYNTNRVKMSLGGTPGHSVVQDVLMTGVYAMMAASYINTTNSISRNGYALISTFWWCVGGIGISLSRGFSGNSEGSAQVLLAVVAPNYGGVRNSCEEMHGCDGSMSGAFGSCSRVGGCSAVFNGNGSSVASEIFGCGTVFASEANHCKATGKLGWSGTFSIPNTIDISGRNSYPFSCGVNCVRAKLPAGGIVWNLRNESRPDSKAAVVFPDYNEVVGAWRAEMSHGTMEKDTVVVRPGGATASLKFTPLSNIVSEKRNNITQGLLLFEWEEGDVPVGARTRTIYIKGEGWSPTFPTAEELFIEAEYYDGAPGTNTKTTAVSTAVLPADSVWTAIPVTFTQAQAGPVRYRLFMSAYVAAAYIHVDAALYRDGKAPMRAYFGEWGLELWQAQDEDWPAEAKVESGINYAFGFYTGAMVIDYPAVGDVRAGVIFDNGLQVGILDLPSTDDVESLVAFDQGLQVGTFVSPPEISVQDGVAYGHAGEFVGKLIWMSDDLEASLEADQDLEGGLESDEDLSGEIDS